MDPVIAFTLLIAVPMIALWLFVMWKDDGESRYITIFERKPKAEK